MIDFILQINTIFLKLTNDFVFFNVCLANFLHRFRAILSRGLLLFYFFTRKGFARERGFCRQNACF
jgi:hypothetical protein